MIIVSNQSTDTKTRQATVILIIANNSTIIKIYDESLLRINFFINGLFIYLKILLWRFVVVELIKQFDVVIVFIGLVSFDIILLVMIIFKSITLLILLLLQLLWFMHRRRWCSFVWRVIVLAIEVVTVQAVKTYGIYCWMIPFGFFIDNIIS